MAVADLADALEIARHRWDRTGRRTDHRLGDEAGDGLRPQTQDFGLQLVGDPAAIGFRSLVRCPVAIGVARADMADAHEQRLELGAAPHVPAGGQSTQRIAVIALPPGDDVVPPGLADLQEVLPRHLERRLDRLGAAGNEVDPVEPDGRRRDQCAGQRLHGLEGRTELGTEVRDLRQVHLPAVDLHAQQLEGGPVWEGSGNRVSGGGGGVFYTPPRRIRLGVLLNF